MDTSKEYINMCEKAVEVQELRKPDDEEVWINGDFYTDDIIKRPTTPVNSCVFEDASDPPCSMYNPIWLPRQDQLQGMLDYEENFSYPVSQMIFDIEEFYTTIKWWGGKDSDHGEITWEQLWLAFVMKEKFNKTWNGTDWKEKPQIQTIFALQSTPLGFPNLAQMAVVSFFLVSLSIIKTDPL